MEQSPGQFEVNRRCHSSAFFADAIKQSEISPLTPVEQSMFDRSRFMAQIALCRDERNLPPIAAPQVIDELSAQAILEQVLPLLSPQYQWMKQVEIEHLTQLLNEVLTFRRRFQSEKGALPSDGRIYREFRLNLERAQQNDETYHKVVMLEALMNGNVTRGTLPPLTPTAPTAFS